jgi:two-component system cell cycle sensor histidine kinase/response regulator CckA
VIVNLRIEELLDIPALQSLLDSLYASSKIPSAIIDTEGKILTTSGWQDACTKFHRVHPEVEKLCIESNKRIKGRVDETRSAVVYTCPQGLTDAATPLIVEGAHVANVFTGQFFLAPPDIGFFRSQARRYGWDEEAYVEAIRRAPVISEETLRKNISFLARFTEMLAATGLKRLREKEAQDRLRASEEWARTILHTAMDGFWLMDGEVNEAYCRMSGYDRGELLAMRVSDLEAIETPEVTAEHIRKVFTGGQDRFETVHRRKDGDTFDVEISVQHRPVDGGRMVAFLRDVTDRKRTVGSLLGAMQQLSAHIDNSPLAVVEFDSGFRVTRWSKEAERVFGWLPEEIMGRAISEMRWAYEEDEELVRQESAGLLKGERHRSLNCNRNYRKDGSVIHCEWYNSGIYDSSGNLVSILSLVLDVTERKRSEEERKRLQSQLQQAMKMEAVGRLAGGVAHDFNNLLTVIIGNVSLALGKVPTSGPIAGMLSEVNRAAERAARLTQQLLAFSRKQIIEPKVLDLNGLIVELHSMLVRLIGENIELTTVPGEELGAVKVDPGQLEQILVNLAVNARDAMRDGGKLSIGASNVELDDAYCASHPDATPGRFVLLSVSDTGHGMSDEVKAQIFEPFFTTKPKGSGTGLGLSMTYGAVKQANGSIAVDSEAGKGTTVKIYLPRIEPEAVRTRESADPQELLDGTETVLLVEDEDVVRNLCVRILERLGYKVLQASNGAEAIGIAQRYGDRIHLLMTDVVMPGMNGSELATQLVILRPETRVLFTSGYTEDAIVHHGVLDEGVFFIGKPYTPSVLARKVREVLDGKRV